MKTTRLFPALAFACLASSAFAQAPSADIHQQQRIEHGLQSGQLSTREAARLEHQEAHIDHAQSRALRDGAVSDAEQRRIQSLQRDASRDIYAEKHDAQTGNPHSASSRRMRADVQRNINQERRIQDGMQDGSLTAHEAARLEHGKARVERTQYRAGRDGHVGVGEQAHVRRIEGRESHRIVRQKHDRQHRD